MNSIELMHLRKSTNEQLTKLKQINLFNATGKMFLLCILIVAELAELHPSNWGVPLGAGGMPTISNSPRSLLSDAIPVSDYRQQRRRPERRMSETPIRHHPWIILQTHFSTCFLSTHHNNSYFYYYCWVYFILCLEVTDDFYIG